MTRRPRKTQAGIVLPFVLLMLFLGVSISTTLLFIRYHSAVAGRERALLAYNQSKLIASRPLLDQAMMSLAEVARTWAQSNISLSGYAFGGSSATSVSNALQPLLQALHARANALCAPSAEGVSIRVYFLSSDLCGSPFPNDGPALPPPRRAGGTPGNLEVYEVPFVAIIEARHDINRRTQRVDGVMRLRVGGGPASQYQVYLGSGYQPDGTPAYFYGGEVYEGPVHVGGTPNFGPQWKNLPGPFFLGGFSTGRCVATSLSGCVGGQRPVGFAQVGAVAPEAVSPSPFDPCYGATCPRFPGGVDWNAPGLPPPTDNTPPAFEYNYPGTYSASLSVEKYSGNYPFIPGGTPVQRVDLTTPDRKTLKLIVTEDQHNNRYIVLRRDPGENLLAVAPWSSVGWWGNTASGGNGEVVLTNRDGYFGGYFRLPTGTSLTWNASFEADTTQANGPAQIGLEFCRPSGICYYWVGTGWGGGQSVPQGRSWTKVTATFTTPADATFAALWFQIDASWNNAGTARFRNLSLTTSVPVEIPLAPLNFGTPTPSPAQALVLRVGGDLDVAGPANEAGVEGNTSFTLRASGTIRIRENLLSTNHPCDPAMVKEGKPVPSRCLARGKGVFGLYSENGDVLLDRGAPAKLYVVAAIAAPNGTFGPEGYPSTTGAGNLYLMGAFLAQNYRHFLSPDRSSGWNLHFSHDPILSADSGRAPPGWPTLPRGVWAVNVLYTRESAP